MKINHFTHRLNDDEYSGPLGRACIGFNLDESISFQMSFKDIKYLSDIGLINNIDFQSWGEHVRFVAHTTHSFLMYFHFKKAFTFEDEEGFSYYFEDGETNIWFSETENPEIFQKQLMQRYLASLESISKDNRIVKDPAIQMLTDSKRIDYKSGKIVYKGKNFNIELTEDATEELISQLKTYFGKYAKTTFALEKERQRYQPEKELSYKQNEALSIIKALSEKENFEFVDALHALVNVFGIDCLEKKYKKLYLEKYSV